MKKLEYRLERIALDKNEHESRMLQLVERLNELGAQGWWVASVDLTPHPSFEPAPVPVLLGREIPG